MKRFQLFLILTLVLLITFACQNEHVLEVEDTMSEELTLQEAKDWFKANIAQTSPNGRTVDAITAFTAKEPLWQVATQALLKNGKTGWLVPLKLRLFS